MNKYLSSIFCSIFLGKGPIKCDMGDTASGMRLKKIAPS